MSLIISAMTWSLGLILGVQVIAAWFGIVDYRYRWDRFRSRVIFQIIGWCLVYYFVRWMLPMSATDDYDNGFIAILIVGLTGIITAPGLTRLYRRKEREKYRHYVQSLVPKKPLCGE
jgi:uncharacterized membrane protein YuzA (DUF378 family)